MELFLEKNWRSLLFLAAILSVVFVWPTLYRYHSPLEQGLPVRENRLTGAVEFWRPYEGWIGKK